MSGVLEEVPFFRTDLLGTYYYNEVADEVEILLKTKSINIRAELLKDMLRGAIHSVDVVQSLHRSTKRDENV